MKKIVALCLALSILACCIGTCFADSNPLIYKVTDDNGNRIYLLGTIHIGRDDMFPITGFDDVLSDCDAVALEIYSEKDFPLDDQESSVDLDDIVQLISMFDLNGPGLDDELMEKLTALPGMEEYALMLPFMSRSALTSMVLVVPLVEATQADPDKSVESYVVSEARKHGLELLGLETSEEQDAVIASQSDDLLLNELKETVEHFDEQVAEVNQMLQAWIKGDRSDFLQEEEAPEDETLAAEWKEFDQRLTDDRNLGFLEDAEGFLKEGKTVLIAVGADHVYGVNGLVDLLAERGYHVEELGGRM